VKKLLALAALAMTGVVAALVAAFVLFFMAVVGLEEAEARPTAGPSGQALADIPPELLAVYRQAARETCGMRWSVLAAFGKVETDHARSTLPGVHGGENLAGAGGPMQFLQPTWDAYGVDGDGDGDRDRYDPVDAIWGAANYLCANGAGAGRERDAIWNYNHADWYVDQVLEIAAGYEAAGTVPTGDAQALADSPNLTLTPEARQDLVGGVLDERLVNFLSWATQRRHVAVSVFKTGHSRYVAGTDRVSNHWYGRAADIYAVDGEDFSPSCRPCRGFVEEVLALGEGRPHELGQPWSDVAAGAGWNVFADEAHANHAHVGWGA
jgi:hypothetical protein